MARHEGLNKALAPLVNGIQSSVLDSPNVSRAIASRRRVMKPFNLPFKFPAELRPTLATTNIIDGINRIFEKIRLNSSGYFQSLDNLKMKLGFSIQSLENGKWKMEKTSHQCQRSSHGHEPLLRKTLRGKLKLMTKNITSYTIILTTATKAQGQAALVALPHYYATLTPCKTSSIPYG